MTNRLAIRGIAPLFAAAALALTAGCGGGGGTEEGAPSDAEIASFLARRISELNPDAGPVLLLAPEEHPLTPLLEKELKGTDVAGVESWTGFDGGLEGSRPLDAATYQNLCARHPEAAVVVAVEGIPDLRDLARWPRKGPHFILYTSRAGRGDLEPFAPALAMAVFPRATPELSAGGLPEDRVLRYFEILTP